MTKESKSIEVLKRKREQSSREVENEKKKKKNGKKNQEWKFPPIYDVYIGLGQFPQQGRIHDVPCRMGGGQGRWKSRSIEYILVQTCTG